jgi:hypothetical protein
MDPRRRRRYRPPSYLPWRSLGGGPVEPRTTSEGAIMCCGCSPGTPAPSLARAAASGGDLERGPERPALGVVAPRSAQRTPIEEDGRADRWAIVERLALDVEGPSADRHPGSARHREARASCRGRTWGRLRGTRVHRDHARPGSRPPETAAPAISPSGQTRVWLPRPSRATTASLAKVQPNHRPTDRRQGQGDRASSQLRLEGTRNNPLGFRHAIGSLAIRVAHDDCGRTRRR